MRNLTGLKRGGSPGRTKGVPNKSTRDAREFCAGIVCDPAYQQSIRQRALAGKLAPVVECMLWHYAHGKPAQPIEQTGDITVTWQSDLLRERIQRARTRTVETAREHQQENP